MQAARAALKQGSHLSALLIALRLKDAQLLRDVIMSTPATEVGLINCAAPSLADSVWCLMSVTAAAQ